MELPLHIQLDEVVFITSENITFLSVSYHSYNIDNLIHHPFFFPETPGMLPRDVKYLVYLKLHKGYIIFQWQF